MYNYLANSPDDLYSHRPHRGKHKIFLSMAPGAGKTYKMLEEAHQMKQEGIDVVIGWLETHGRKETVLKAKDLEIIPPKKIQQVKLALYEMDVDAIITRQPQLILIDELAHTNLLGSQNKRRYQDVEAILAAGIDVYSTVNIQHLESLSQEVTDITGLVVKESIPYCLFANAENVVFVDATPEILEERLSEGKIYPSSKMKPEVQNFFQRRNIVALRKLALRQVADKIEQQKIQEASQFNKPGRECNREVCSIQERILICISNELNSLNVIIRGARLAEYMNAPFHVLFIEKPDSYPSKEQKIYLASCKQMCQELKGEFLHISALNTAEEIAKVAKDYRITQVIFGQTNRPFWQTLLSKSLSNQLMHLIKNIDIHIISTTK